MFDDTNKSINENENENDIVQAESNNESQSNAAVDNNTESNGIAEVVAEEAVIDEQKPEDTALQSQISAETPVPVQSISDSPSLGGIAYTKNIDGKVANCYEWNSPNAENTSRKQKKSKNGFGIFIAVIATIFTISLIATSGLLAVYIIKAGNDNVSTNVKSNSLQSSENFDYSSVTLDNDNFVKYDFAQHDGEALSIPQVAAKCSPSAVGIISEVEVSYNYPFYFSPSTSIAEASGSGFIYSSEGYVITNHHVVEDASKITVVLSDGTKYEAKLVGSDSLSDIAVLKIEPGENEQLIPMEIGDSSQIVVGEQVVAIGCPAGIEFIGTVTDGIISAINRNVEITDSSGNVQKIMTLIQTNATINHGNSGGPLINTRGQVIGINTLKLADDYEGIGFSIPINGAVSIIKQLIDYGEVVERTEDDFAASKGMIGINGSEITNAEAEYYDIPTGVLVIQIGKNSSAAKAGLRRGDIITHYNGEKVESIADINNLKGSAMAGEMVTLTVYRDSYDGKSETFDITFKLDPQE